MCGLVAYSGGIKTDLLLKSIDAVSHRGPDDSGYKTNKREAVGHTRLAIQDISQNGAQPMSFQNVTIVFNGEIYNVNELRDKLKMMGYSFKGSSDTEVILKLYIEFKTNFLEKLDGIFAFVIWDEEKNILFVARDSLGIKPLYYSQVNKKFVCASEIKSIISDKTFNKDINIKTLMSHMVYVWAPYPDTMFENILKLEPGCALIVKNGKIINKWFFYELSVKEINNEKSKDNLIEELKDHLFNAVKKQLISDVPIGSFLSGGIDSSAIAAIAKKVQPDLDLKTFSINIRGINNNVEGMSDDLPYAKYMANYLGLDLNIVDVDSSIISNLNKTIYHLDAPIGDPAAINTLLISNLARENGIKVLLSGTGGDDLFSGYRRHKALMLEKYMNWMPNFLLNSISKYSDKVSNISPLTRRLKKVLQYSNLSGNKKIVSYFYWINPEYLNTLMNDIYTKDVSNFNISSPLLEGISKLDGYHSLNKMLYLELKHFLSDHNLNYNDKMGMANGVEIRVPLLDRDIVEFACSLPVKYKYNRSPKWILKEALNEILPRKIINRKKSGFGAPLRYWIKNDLKEVINDILSKESIHNRGIFDYKGLEKLKNNSKIDSSYTIFSMLCIELWFREFIDN